MASQNFLERLKGALAPTLSPSPGPLEQSKFEARAELHSCLALQTNFLVYYTLGLLNNQWP